MTISTALKNEAKLRQIDLNLTLEILTKISNHTLPKPLEASGIPDSEDPRIFRADNDMLLKVKKKVLEHKLKELVLPTEVESKLSSLLNFKEKTNSSSDIISVPQKGLYLLGKALYKYCAFGILNGGSATSYVDRKKNRLFNERLFELYRDEFNRYYDDFSGKPKGITPALFHDDGTAGPSFMTLKIRSLLIKELEYRNLFGHHNSADLLPFVQMTSQYNNDTITAYLETIGEDPFLKGILQKCRYNLKSTLSAKQPLISAFSKDQLGSFSLFTEAFGEKGRMLALPGGHGQCFQVLKDIILSLEKKEKKFFYITNIDNLGATVKPEFLAILYLTEKPAAFEFSYKTPIDKKGGILVSDSVNNLHCGDIGPAISASQLAALESQGKPVLFNCATGLFNVNYLMSNLDRIINELPLRISKQSKDSGEYFQAEQVTWEVMSMIDDPLFLGVDKFSRFLPAKLLLDAFLTNGLKKESAAMKEILEQDEDLAFTAKNVISGLESVMHKEYGIVKENGFWQPVKDH